MDITWLGHACIRIRTQPAALVMDPVDKEAGFDMGRPTADIVTISHDHPSHSNLRGIKGETIVLNGPGEYEIKGVQIMGVATSLRLAGENGKRERNTAYVVEAEDLRVAHLGGLGSPLTPEQEEQLGNVDVLVIPVGGDTVVDAREAARIVRELEPRVVIPIHYAPASQAGEDGPLQAFIKAVGIEPEPPEQRASIQRRGLGDSARILILEARGQTG